MIDKDRQIGNKIVHSYPGEGQGFIYDGDMNPGRFVLQNRYVTNGIGLGNTSVAVHSHGARACLNDTDRMVISVAEEVDGGLDVQQYPRLWDIHIDQIEGFTCLDGNIPSFLERYEFEEGIIILLFSRRDLVWGLI